MKVLKTELMKVIEDEVRAVLGSGLAVEGKKKPNMAKKLTKVKASKTSPTDAERKRAIFPGTTDIDKLQKGLMPENEDELEELNISHDKSGRFSSSKDATCKSSYFLDKKRNRVGGSLTDKHASGRGKKKYKGTGRYRCKDNSLKFEEEKILGSPHSEKVLIPDGDYACAKELQKNKYLIKKLKNKVIAAKNAGRSSCPLSINDAAELINRLELASKGSLHKPVTTGK